MGHSLGEYGALVAAGVLPFAQALEAVSARGHEMASLDSSDPGAMAAVAAPPEAVEAVIAQIDGYVVLANVNSSQQVVLGGATEPGARGRRAPAGAGPPGDDAAREPRVPHRDRRAGERAAARDAAPAGRRAAAHPGRRERRRRALPGPARTPWTGSSTSSAARSPRPCSSSTACTRSGTQGARVFVETGPKRALQGFASDVLGDDDALNLHTNHPKSGDLPSFNVALCGLYAAGCGVGAAATRRRGRAGHAPRRPRPALPPPSAARPRTPTLLELGRLFADTLQRGRALLGDDERERRPATASRSSSPARASACPATDQLFDEHNLAADPPRRAVHRRHPAGPAPRDRRPAHHPAGQGRRRAGERSRRSTTSPTSSSSPRVPASFDLESEFGVDAGRIAALGRATQLAVAAGIDALRDAGIPLVQHYRDTTTGTQLPDRWALPEALRDDTGIVFGSAFPGYDEFADELDRFWADRSRREQLRQLEEILARVPESDEVARAEIERRIHDVRLELEEHAYAVRPPLPVPRPVDGPFAVRGADRRARAQHAAQRGLRQHDAGRRGRRGLDPRRPLPAGDRHRRRRRDLRRDAARGSARGSSRRARRRRTRPSRTRRCRSTSAATACCSAWARPRSSSRAPQAARERGSRRSARCSARSPPTARSTGRGSTSTTSAQVMEGLVAERRGAPAASPATDIAPELVFVSHETYTPARGGSAAAEIHALREVFGDRADSIVIANTKGFTGHPMGVGHRGRRRGEGAGDGRRPAGPELPRRRSRRSGRSTCRRAGRTRCATRCGWRPASGRRSRCCSCAGRRSRTGATATRRSWGSTTASSDRARVGRLAGPRQRPGRAAARGRPASAARRRPRAGRGAGGAGDSAVPGRRTGGRTGRRPRPRGPAAPAAAETPAGRPPTTRSSTASWPSSPNRPATPPTSWTPTSTSKPTWASTPSSRPRSSPPSAKPGTSPATTTSNSATTPPSTTSPNSSATTPAHPHPRHRRRARDRARRPRGGRRAPAPAGDAILDSVLAVVAEQTGYPTDLLDPDLDLEADLGIDTVKQAEVFATIREAWDIPRDDNLKLRDYPTLNHVAQFVRDHTGTPAPAATTAAPATEPAAAADEPGGRGPRPVIPPPRADGGRAPAARPLRADRRARSARARASSSPPTRGGVGSRADEPTGGARRRGADPRHGARRRRRGGARRRLAAVRRRHRRLLAPGARRRGAAVRPRPGRAGARACTGA